MTIESWLMLVISLAVLIYLIVTLLRPEKF
jgi:K+-transporting ATPase KdpF subunit